MIGAIQHSGRTVPVILGLDVPDEAFIVLALEQPATPEAISGVVRYPSAFNEV